MILSAGQIATLIGGAVEGDSEKRVEGPAKIEHAGENHISFLSDSRYEKYLYQNQPGILIIANSFKPKQRTNTTFIRVESVYPSVQKLLKLFVEKAKDTPAIAKSAVIADSASIGKNASIEDYVLIGKQVKIGDNVRIMGHCQIMDGAQIGANTCLYPGVKVYPKSIIGAHCIVHANAVIGSDGFGYAKGKNDNLAKIEHLGNVLIHDHVEIGANTTIDRAVMGSTVIGAYVKLDNLIQIAHNVQIGDGTAIAAQTGIAGSTIIGKNCRIGGQVAIIGHITIADGVELAAKSGVVKSIDQTYSRWAGAPAVPAVEFLRTHSLLRKLRTIWKDIVIAKNGTADS